MTFLSILFPEINVQDYYFFFMVPTIELAFLILAEHNFIKQEKITWTALMFGSPICLVTFEKLITASLVLTFISLICLFLGSILPKYPNLSKIIESTTRSQ